VRGLIYGYGKWHKEHVPGLVCLVARALLYEQRVHKECGNAVQRLRYILSSVNGSNASCKDAGMTSPIIGVAVLQTWFLWFGGSVILRLLGLPAALLTLYLEACPATASLTIHRLSRRLRLRLQSFVCVLKQEKHDMSSTTSMGGSAVMSVAESVENKASIGPKGASSNSHASSNSTTLSHPSPPIVPMSHSRSKTASHVDVVRQGKRLSLQFPIQPAGSKSPKQAIRSRPSSWVAPLPLLSPDGEGPPSETSYLAVLAAQERYVLELKEELLKAEADLKMLKKHYADHESSRLRQDVRKVTQLQPLSAALPKIPSTVEDEDGSGSCMQREMERRKALLTNTKSSQRKVFSGSRHLRTLSLLSPEKSYAPSFPQPLDLQEEEPANKRSEPPARPSTASDIVTQVAETTNIDRYDLGGMPNIQREQLIRAGTQMATDIKNGLFGFIEDIRQATVGDEAINGPVDGSGTASVKGASNKTARKASKDRPTLDRSASSKKSAPQSGSVGDDFWKEMGLSEPKTSPTHSKKTHTNKPAQTPQKQIPNYMDDEEEWDNWETPNDTYKNTHNSSDESDEETSPGSGPGSSRTSTRYHSKRHDSKASTLTTSSSTSNPDDAASKRSSIPWPDLVKLSPNNLKRTASHLMKEWEKQLTPPPESRQASHAHGGYLDHSGSPTSLI
jgi:hypothetical protein